MTFKELKEELEKEIERMRKRQFDGNIKSFEEERDLDLDLLEKEAKLQAIKQCKEMVKKEIEIIKEKLEKEKGWIYVDVLDELKSKLGLGESK